MDKENLTGEKLIEMIIVENNLEKTKAQYLLDNFSHYFAVADEWEKKAKSLVVTHETQLAEMEMARVGRLFLRNKRLDIERARKTMKESALREGKAIDGIANVLKAVIVPIEEYLESQEKFVEYKIRDEMARKEVERIAKEEADRIAKEEADRIENERIRIENDRLQKEKKALEEKAIAEKAKADAEKKALEEKLAGIIKCPKCGHKFKNNG